MQTSTIVHKPRIQIRDIYFKAKASLPKANLSCCRVNFITNLIKNYRLQKPCIFN